MLPLVKLLSPQIPLLKLLSPQIPLVADSNTPRACNLIEKGRVGSLVVEFQTVHLVDGHVSSYSGLDFLFLTRGDNELDLTLLSCLLRSLRVVTRYLQSKGSKTPITQVQRVYDAYITLFGFDF